MDDPAARRSRPPAENRALGGRPGAGYRRALRVGLAFSAAVHVAALLVYPRLMHHEVTDPVPFLLPATGSPVDGMTVIELVAVADADEPESPPEPEEVAPVEEPPGGARRAPGLDDTEGVGLVAPGPTAAERLRPRLDDARLWAPLGEEARELPAAQRLELELTGRIADWNDSMAAVAEAQRAATDWTYTDGDGKRWGVADGKIYLGDFALPIPFGFAAPLGKRDEMARRAWEWQEIERGAAAGAVRESWKDRAEAIRARRDRERAAAKADTIPRR
jgi:hypothetical protein